MPVRTIGAFDEAGVAGKYGVDAGEIAGGGDLGILEGQGFVAEGGGQDVLRSAAGRRETA